MKSPRFYDAVATKRHCSSGWFSKAQFSHNAAKVYFAYGVTREKIVPASKLQLVEGNRKTKEANDTKSKGTDYILTAVH